MIVGIGCDLCSVERIRKSLESTHGARFAARVFGQGIAPSDEGLIESQSYLGSLA